MREAKFARRLGYRSKSLVRPDHAKALNEVLTPPPMNSHVRRRSSMV